MERLRLRVTPAIDASDVVFLSGFSRHSVPEHGELPSLAEGGITRMWPGQPAVASPWVPCADGCCLVLAPSRARVDAAGQWLRFLIAEFLGAPHRLDGCVEVPGSRGRGPVLLLVDGDEVFEGELGELPGLSPGLPRPARARHTPPPAW